jgi:hypothetical protein
MVVLIENQLLGLSGVPLVDAQHFEEQRGQV